MSAAGTMTQIPFQCCVIVCTHCRAVGKVAVQPPFRTVPVVARSMSSLVGRNAGYSMYSYSGFSTRSPFDPLSMVHESEPCDELERNCSFQSQTTKENMSSRELEQQHESQKIANWSLGVDIFMTTVKGAVGWMLNSTAIIADISIDDSL